MQTTSLQKKHCSFFLFHGGKIKISTLEENQTSKTKILSMVKKVSVLAILVFTLTSTFSQVPKTSITRRFVPTELSDTLWLEHVRDKQLEDAKNIGAFHD